MKLLTALRKSIDLFQARKIDITGLKTVCLAVGPYRNLTTLTGSVLFLHPECQVLNHGGSRIFNDPKLDWIKKYDPKRFENFCRYAIQISKKGRKGNYGGSITRSHAFRNKKRMTGVFEEAGLALVKNKITSLFWKESQRTSNIFMKQRDSLELILESNPKVKFLLPIRNPMDCARSNLKTGHVRLFKDLSSNPSLPDVIDSILVIFEWFRNLQSIHPDRFYCFFAHSFGRETLEGLTRFLMLGESNQWFDHATQAFKVDSRYQHEKEIVQHFERGVKERFSTDAPFREALLQYLPA